MFMAAMRLTLADWLVTFSKSKQPLVALNVSPDELELVAIV